MSVTRGYNAAAEEGGKNTGAGDSPRDVWPSWLRRTKAETGSIKKADGHKSRVQSGDQGRTHTVDGAQNPHDPTHKCVGFIHLHGSTVNTDQATFSGLEEENAFSGSNAGVTDDVFLICIRPAAMLRCVALGGLQYKTSLGKQAL